MTSFDLSSSPVYLGGIPENEHQFLEEYVPLRPSFVGAIQKVVINGAELVLAGPSMNEHQVEHWEDITQWQGPPCGESYSTCGQDPASLKRICRPLGSSYECSCSTPLTHMSFVRHLTSTMFGIDLLNNITAQREISNKAEEMACNAISKLRGDSKDLQHDVPNKDDEIVVSLHKNRQNDDGDSGKFSMHSSSVQFTGGTIINYRGLIQTE